MLAQLLSFLSSVVLLFYPSSVHIHPQVLASSHTRPVTATITLTPPPSLSPSVPPPIKSPTAFHSPLLDCVGPDGKHLQVTEATCTTFNNAWHHPSSTNPVSAWGNAIKVGDHTYTMQYIPDDAQASPQEILQALNTYRQKKGVGLVTWIDSLSKYAQTRVDFFVANGKLDEHTGFIDYVNNQEGFSKLGFNKLGENAAYAGPLTGLHIIENVFGGDTEHNTNQLNNAWTYAGIGVNGSYIDVIFGAEKR